MSNYFASIYFWCSNFKSYGTSVLFWRRDWFIRCRWNENFRIYVYFFFSFWGGQQTGKLMNKQLFQRTWIDWVSILDLVVFLGEIAGFLVTIFNGSINLCSSFLFFFVFSLNSQKFWRVESKLQAEQSCESELIF